MNTSATFFASQAFPQPVPVTPDKNEVLEPVYSQATNPLDDNFQSVVSKVDDAPCANSDPRKLFSVPHDIQLENMQRQAVHRYQEYDVFPKNPVTLAGIDGGVQFPLYERLGAGAYGDVYRSVRVNEYGRLEDCAIKIVPSDNDEICFEAEALQALNHQNIIKCYGTILDAPNRKLGFVMELGVMNVAQRHQKQAIDASDLKVIATAVAKALEYCHAVGIAHMDIKPENVMIMSEVGSPLQECDVKLCDFGYAHPAGTTSESKGTKNYHAPEMIPGEKYDTRMADMWSFGVMVMELSPSLCPLGFWNHWTNYYGHYDNPDDPQRDVFRNGLKCCIRLFNKNEKYRSMPVEERPPCLEFIKQTVKMDPEGRLTAQKAVDWLKKC